MKPESYRAINVAVLAIVIYGLCIPLILPLIRGVAPLVSGVCASQRIFGIPCPLCGLTRGIGALMRGDLSTAIAFNVLSIPALFLLVCELLYRLRAVCIRLPPDSISRIVRVDMWLHATLLAIYLFYAVAFVVYSIIR